MGLVDVIKKLDEQFLNLNVGILNLFNDRKNLPFVSYGIATGLFAASYVMEKDLFSAGGFICSGMGAVAYNSRDKEKIKKNTFKFEPDYILPTIAIIQLLPISNNIIKIGYSISNNNSISTENITNLLFSLAALSFINGIYSVRAVDKVNNDFKFEEIK